jgi:CTP:phosphocholine cytidylyltransferase-like protein/thiamine kinase-like enzyme
MKKYKVDNAIILAAGFGSRFIPLSFEMPKGLIPVKGRAMIERQIEQLKEAGIPEVIIVTGYMREKYAYLREKYDGIRLIHNREYAVKNNLSSLYSARRYLKNSYILSSDNWIRDNIFSAQEERSWYSCVYQAGETSEWCVSAAEDGRINGVTIGGRDSWVMYGPVFLSESFSIPFAEKLYQYYHQLGTEKYMWENVFIDEMDLFDLYINKQEGGNVYEFENIEELRRFDPAYGYATGNKCLKLISDVFHTEEKNISRIELIKSGMTNSSFSFILGDDSYIFRQPGQGSNLLIDRKKEKAVYDVIKDLHISDDVIYFDAAEGGGIKISVYYQGAANTNAQNRQDVLDSLRVLRRVHRSGRKTAHAFSIGAEINHYLNLVRRKDNIKYLSKAKMYLKMIRLINVVKKISVDKTLCHIDCNPDNFIRLNDGSVRLIDWEYAGMGDPIIDISMYAIYSYYAKKEADELLALYLEREPRMEERIRLYAYMSLGGFLWMLWTEYKHFFGIEFGEYGLKMRQYAEVYYDYAISLMESRKRADKK